MDIADEQRGPALFADSRGRVPFAIIAVLLLLSAVALVGYLETRESGETETDATLAVDRTDGAIQTTLRDATASAAQQAAAEPLTTPANTSFGNALDADRPFASYLEALVYLEAVERFDETGQRVGDVETTVSLPGIHDIESFEAALDRVSVTGDGAGLLTVTLDGVETTATRDGDPVASQTETVEVSVPTPVLRQHERTEQFQQRLDAGVTDAGSFSQRFNTRIYTLGWFRGYAQYGGAPVTEVIANRHIEPSANSALYRTQQDVFGAVDPTLENAVRRGWFCMVAQDAEDIYGEYTAGQPDVAEDICEASEWILGEKHTGELPDAPDVLDMLGEVPGMDEEHTIGVNETAYAPLRSLVAGDGEYSIEAAIERAFTIETDVDTEWTVTDPPAFDHGVPEGWTRIDTERTQTGLGVEGGSVTPGEPAVDDSYVEFSNVGVSLEITETVLWETESGSLNQTTAGETLEVTLALELSEHETAPGLHVAAFDNASVDREYEIGPTDSSESTVPTPAFENYAGSESRVPEAVLGGADLDALEDWLASNWGEVTYTENLTLPARQNATLEPDPVDRTALVTTAVDDITGIQESVEDITHTFERTDLVHEAGETGPVGELATAVATEREAHLAREEPYENVGQRAVYEVRHAYFETLVDDLESVDEAHGAVMGDLDDHLDDVDSGLDDALSFLQQGNTGDEPAGQPIASPELVPEITYQVRGSPTYLAGEPVTTEEVPAVAQNETVAPFAAKNHNHLKLPYDSVIGGILDTVLNALGFGSPDAELTLRTAGEALRAGELAEVAADDEYGDGDELGDLTDELHEATAEGLYGHGGFVDEMGFEVVGELYGVEPAGIPPLFSDPEHQAAFDAVEDATESALVEYGDVATAAIEVGGGNATEPLVAEITDALGGVERPAYAANLTDENWEQVVASAVPPALDRAASDATATLDSTDLVEDLDTETRQALENVSTDIVEDRLAEYVGNGTFDLSEYEEWVGDGDSIDTPVRVPAGLPVLPVPTKWVATVNAWDIDADGAYTRFEVEANMSAPGRATSTTYVREDATVELDIGGETRQLGETEPIAFDGRSVLVVVVPPGGVGVGDRDDENPECTETYPVVGPFDESETACPPDG